MSSDSRTNIHSTSPANSLYFDGREIFTPVAGVPPSFASTGQRRGETIYVPFVRLLRFLIEASIGLRLHEPFPILIAEFADRFVGHAENSGDCTGLQPIHLKLKHSVLRTSQQGPC